MPGSVLRRVGGGKNRTEKGLVNLTLTYQGFKGIR